MDLGQKSILAPINRANSGNRATSGFGPSKQTGMSKWGWLILIIVLIGSVMTALRVAPHYFDFEMVKGVTDRLAQGEVHEMTKADIREHFTKQFRVEGFRIPLKEIMTIDRNADTTTLDFSYEIREHMFYNVDAVLVFSEQREYN